MKPVPEIDFALLETIVKKLSPDQLFLVEELHHGAVSNDSGNFLREIIHTELLREGFEGEDFNVNAYGERLEDLIDLIGRQTEGLGLPES